MYIILRICCSYFLFGWGCYRNQIFWFYSRQTTILCCYFVQLALLAFTCCLCTLIPILVGYWCNEILLRKILNYGNIIVLMKNSESYKCTNSAKLNHVSNFLLLCISCMHIYNFKFDLINKKLSFLRRRTFVSLRATLKLKLYFNSFMREASVWICMNSDQPDIWHPWWLWGPI